MTSRIISYSVIFIFLGLNFFSCFSFKEYEYADKELVRSFCYPCHTPYYAENDIVLSKVYPKFSSDRLLKKYLTSEFVKKNNNKQVHDDLLLTKEDIDAIGSYLKYIYINH